MNTCNVPRSHFIAELLPQSGSVWFAPRSLAYLVLSSWPPEQHWGGVHLMEQAFTQIRYWLIVPMTFALLLHQRALQQEGHPRSWVGPLGARGVP